jgi:hypothetical protein
MSGLASTVSTTMRSVLVDGGALYPLSLLGSGETNRQARVGDFAADTSLKVEEAIAERPFCPQSR